MRPQDWRSFFWALVCLAVATFLLVSPEVDSGILGGLMITCAALYLFRAYRPSGDMNAERLSSATLRRARVVAILPWLVGMAAIAGVMLWEAQPAGMDWARVIGNLSLIAIMLYFVCVLAAYNSLRHDRRTAHLPDHPADENS